MHKHQLLDASCRVAIAAYLHDLGKFAERAAIAEAEQRDASGVAVKDMAKQEYCPNFNNRYSHVHAAYTAIAMDVLEQHLPDIKRHDCYPFASWAAGNMGEQTDSLINAAARHHKPETFMQWVVACADRLASGFDRDEFELYNQAEEENQDKHSHVTARMEVLLEKISLEQGKRSAQHRYPLLPFSPSALIPQDKSKVQPANNAAGREQYQALWQGFLAALKRESGEDAIPQSHKNSLTLWLDHFDTLWLTYTHAIPSATAAKKPGGGFMQIPADVSLYDHAKTTAALAVALWRWHEANGLTDEAAAKAIKSGADYDEDKFLLVQGDMFGIQDFIFQTGGNTNKFSSKLLRGRSFYVSLMAECAAVRVLEALGLPSTSQVINAAGKFTILAPNTEDSVKALQDLREEFDAWSIDKTQGRVGIGLAWTLAKPQDFITNASQTPAFAELLNKLFSELEVQKYQRLQLWSAERPAVLSQYMDAFVGGKLCEIDGVSPAVGERHGIAVGQLAKDHIAIGDALARYQRIVVTREKLVGGLEGDILGLHVHFAQAEEISGRYAKEVNNQNLLRCWDFSLPDADGDKPLWKGYARRYINGYVARFSAEDLYSADKKYKQFEAELDAQQDKGAVKSFNHLACEDRIPCDQYQNPITDPTSAESWIGTPGLHALKGDVDDLGAIFQKGYERPNFAKMAALSRQVNSFFAIYLPWLCVTEFNDSYTVFAGGDDFFLLGPWRSQMQLVWRMQQEFSRYVAGNPQIHFSAGLYLTKPGLPIRQLADGAEQLLEQAKGYEQPQTGAKKNAVTCFGYSMGWDEFKQLLDESLWLESTRQRMGLSTGYIYGLLGLAEMADKKNATDPQKAMWRSHLSYRTYRWVSDKRKPEQGESPQDYQERIKQEASELTGQLVEKLKRYGGSYQLALSTYLYSYRD